jgi:hypothetical protein
MKKLIKLFSLIGAFTLCLGMTLLTTNQINVKAEEDDPIVIDFYILPIQTGIYYWQENQGVYFIYNPNITSSTFADTTLLEFYNRYDEDLTPLTDTTLTVNYLKSWGMTTTTKVTELWEEIDYYIMSIQESITAVYEDIIIIDIQNTVLNDGLFTHDLVAKIEVKPNSHISITYDVNYMTTTLNNVDDMLKMLVKHRNNIIGYWTNFGGDYTEGYYEGYDKGYIDMRSEFGIFIDGEWLSAEEYAIIVEDGLQEQIDALEQQLENFQYGPIDYFLLEFNNWIIPAIAVAVFGGGLFMLFSRKREV